LLRNCRAVRHSKVRARRNANSDAALLLQQIDDPGRATTPGSEIAGPARTAATPRRRRPQRRAPRKPGNGRDRNRLRGDLLIGRARAARRAPPTPLARNDRRSERIPTMPKTMRDLLLHELRDIYHAEKQLTKALPKLARAAS